MTMLANQNDGVRSDSPSLTGRFWANVWDLDCVLELHLNEMGHTEGWFEADGQRLEVSGDAPDERGEISARIRAANLREPFALFRARAHGQGLLLEIRTAPEPSSFERVAFVRLS
jgi:hypothetical protein